ncbi:hypothetical protein Rxyl_0615 [Rubrobacter xylanophilus DSM 9941]|uniref:Uncharacterized protein n=1 Tax=Rubrobacter xylanophilus (strain DSM 9941 / JCM 11954 / NBRC 16129 / PRD-1) TaxID=266117 RepID=Q1AYE2_RUBXD|nr:hypothetical protein [Rubrobacter xylanophilus]ABG03586.1 hypothetical protein Rxyl_0615 [Rubrobacter xylanophilus DSM 9941]
MAKYVVGAFGALLGAFAGVWLMVAPFALAYQPEGAGWADPTLTDFWTGVVVLAVSAAGLAAYSLGLAEELRERGVLPRRRGPSAPAAPGAPPPDDLERALMPLIGAMLRDLQEEQRRRDRAAGAEGGDPR